MTPALQRLRSLSRLIKAALWAVIAVCVGLAVAGMLAGRSWISAAVAAAVAILSAVPLGWPPRCGHYAQLFHGVGGVGCVCQRTARHRGLHRDRVFRWDGTGKFLNTGSERAMYRTVRALSRPFAFVTAQLGFGARCGHRSQLMRGYGDMPLTCKLRRGHWGPHRGGLAVWTGDEAGSRHAGGPS